MSDSATQALGVGGVVYALMIAEALLSRRNERALRARGAVEPRDDVYPLMQVAYPVAFLALLLEGWWRGPAGPAWWTAGAAIFVAGKTIKYWAIASLGALWSFRVLVVPRVPLVSGGPYRFMRHPNYAGIVGEILGVAVMMAALFSGPAALIVFGSLLWKRVRTEERALGR
jgi:methyltransferase